jgi:adenylate cyclase
VTPPPFSLADALRALSTPATPTKWTTNYIDEITARGSRRVGVLKDRIEGITDGRVMPDRDDITIGSGRRFDLAVLFLDICGFSTRSNWSSAEQEQVLLIMNIFMAEMLSIVHDFKGTYEKNTGDGLMAYFGKDGTTEAERIKPAVEAAVIMHYVNDAIISPWFKSQNIEPVTFRIGIDYGPVTIARVGIHGEKSSRVAIGTAANIACKLMNRIPKGGICIGDEVYKSLPVNWAGTCRKCEELSGFVYLKTKQPYDAWELNHRLTAPASNLFNLANAATGNPFGF